MADKRKGLKPKERALATKAKGELTGNQWQNTPKPLRLKPKQKQTIKYWTDPSSKTYGNLYKSAVEAGFRPSYALNLAHLRPSWLSETIETAQLEPEHLKQGIQQIATSKSLDSRSPADTNLKAYELLLKLSGLIDNKHGATTNILVQPILNGESVQATRTKVVTIDDNKDKDTHQATHVPTDDE